MNLYVIVYIAWRKETIQFICRYSFVVQRTSIFLLILLNVIDTQVI